MTRLVIRMAKSTSLSRSGSTSETGVSVAYFAVRMATTIAVAMSMDEPSFGQSGLRS